MNRKSLFYLILILIVATLLRLWHLDKPEGMWNDEYLTWKIASAKFPAEFFTALRTNCHAPLHYLYLKMWMFFFKDSDWMLRLSSLIPGVLGIVVMFFASLEYKKKDGFNVGIVTAFFCAISSFLIYFSQEIRIYSLLFLITSCVLLFVFKIFNNPSKKNFFWYSFFSLLLILTHTIGFVFVFFSTAALLVFAIPQKKAKDFLLFSILGVILLALPFVPLIARILFANNSFSQWWAPFDYSRTAFFFTDIYSPVLNDTFHTFNKFSDAFYKGGVVNLGYFAFAIIPAAIGLLCFINGLLNPKRRQGYMFSVIVCTLLTTLIAAIAGKLIFVTKYMIEVIPLFIIVSADGFCAFKSKAFKITIATIFTVLTLFYITISNTSAVRMVREEGQRLPVMAMAEMGLKKNDKILFLYYPKEWFYKYVDFKNPNNEPYLTASHITKHDFAGYLVRRAEMKDVYKNGKEILHQAFLSKENSNVRYRLNKMVFEKLEKGDRFFLVDLTSVSFFPPDVVNGIAGDESAYKKVPILFLAMSSIKDNALKEAERLLVYDGYLDTGAWRIYVFKKA